MARVVATLQRLVWGSQPSDLIGLAPPRDTNRFLLVNAFPSLLLLQFRSLGVFLAIALSLMEVQSPQLLHAHKQGVSDGFTAEPRNPDRYSSHIVA